MNTHSRSPIAFRSSRRRRSLVSLALVGAATTLVGCSSYQAPTMQVLDARVIERTADGAVVQFTIEAKNGNNNPLPLREAKYSLDLNGQTVFTGIRSAECTLRQSGAQQFVLPAAVKASSLASMGGAVRYRLAGSLTYVTPGAFAELLFDSGVARPSAGFSGEGEIDLPEAATPPSATLGAR